MKEPKLWITIRRIQDGRIISWRQGRKLMFQITVADGKFVNLKTEGVNSGEKTMFPYISPHGVPSWKESLP